MFNQGDSLCLCYSTALYKYKCFLSGGLSIAHECVSDWQLYSEEDVEAADFIEENLPEHAVFITGRQHLNPVASLAGRTIVCGPNIWLYYHGLDTNERAMDIADFYSDPLNHQDVLEKYGVVTNLDIRIWEQVCAWLREMLDSGIRPVPISVNVSRIDLYSVDVAEVLNELTEKHQISHDLIKVEITESAYIEDSERVQETISRLRKDGFQILMDDFGSGYSSLNMLRSVKVDVIKLDAQFLRFSVGEERKGVNILESVISMTKSLDIPVIVEGVENQELVQFLKDMGCRYIQGFFYYHPMLKEEFVSLMQKPDMVDFGGITIQRNQQVHIREFLDNNIYSDNMLNNILGPVAFYCLKDRDVNIIRFNQQFVELLGLASDVLEARRYHILGPNR